VRRFDQEGDLGKKSLYGWEGTKSTRLKPSDLSHEKWAVREKKEINRKVYGRGKTRGKHITGEKAVSSPIP